MTEDHTPTTEPTDNAGLLAENTLLKALLKAALGHLEYTVNRAISMTDFLHGCLTEPETFKYSYPHQTTRQLEEWRRMFPPVSMCFHSNIEPGCPSCAHGQRMREIHEDIKAIYSLD